MKYAHEIRDPIHNFIHMDTDEFDFIDLRQFQRLRHIHQMGLTYLVYPAATHRRFEHSLGVMELAGRVYDVVTRPENIHESVRHQFPNPDASPQGAREHALWRLKLRMAALCHDMGHLPFSHVAEGELLDGNWDHEMLTRNIIESDEMKSTWSKLEILDPTQVAKLAIGPRKYTDSTFSVQEAVLSEIIIGDAFGVDRIDYLLRDAYHAGVVYGKLDTDRLIDTLRILPKEEGSEQPALGIEDGGLHSAEALGLARYFMYNQVYLHRTVRIYNIHLRDFLKDHLKGGGFSIDLERHLRISDNEIMAALLEASRDHERQGHDPAKRIVEREHFRELYQRNKEDLKRTPRAACRVYEAACEKFGPENVRYDLFRARGEVLGFPVLMRDGKIAQSSDVSALLQAIPPVATEYVFLSPSIDRNGAKEWLAKKRDSIIQEEDLEEEEEI